MLLDDVIAILHLAWFENKKLDEVWEASCCESRPRNGRQGVNK